MHYPKNIDLPSRLIQINQYVCDSGGYWVHWEGPYISGSYSYTEQCKKPAVVIQTHNDHPEWKPVYRCAEHIITPEQNPDLTTRNFKAMAKTNICENCKYVSTSLNPLVKAKDGKMVHQSHFVDPNSKYYRQQAK